MLEVCPFFTKHEGPCLSLECSDGNQHKQSDPVSPFVSERWLCSRISYLKTSYTETALCQVFLEWLCLSWPLKSTIVGGFILFCYCWSDFEPPLQWDLHSSLSGHDAIVFSFLISCRYWNLLSHKQPSLLVQAFSMVCDYQVLWRTSDISISLTGVSRVAYFDSKTTAATVLY